MNHARLLVYSESAATSASCQIRVLGLFRELGFKTRVVDPHQCDLNRLCHWMKSDCDALIVHRAIRKRCRVYKTIVETAHCLQIPVIYDTDDLLINVCKQHPDYSVYERKALYALKALLDADYVVASTPTLAGYLAAFDRPVRVIANRLPPSHWEKLNQRESAEFKPDVSEPLTIGYIASETHGPDLQAIEDSLISVLTQERGRVRFLSVGVPLTGKLRSSPHVEQRMPPKRARQDYAEFAQFAATLSIDVGIAPLNCNDFNRCKSDIKFQEYAALGIPAVYSDLEPYQQRVRSGVTGYLARTDAEWTSALRQLISCPQKRRAIAKEASLELLREWRSETALAQWAEVLDVAARTAACPRTRSCREKQRAVLGGIVSYQEKIERQLKRTCEYQLGRLFRRFIRKLAS